MKSIISLFLVAFPFTLFAQGVPTDDFRMHYTGTMMSGLQVGCTDCRVGNQINASAYLINGVQLTKRLNVGVGIGADSYQQWKVMPLFFSISEKLAGNKNGLLLQLNIGHSWAWFDRQQAVAPAWPGWQQSPGPIFSQQGGLMIHPALVYQIGLDKFNINFSVGYKRQTASNSTRWEWQTFQGLIYNEATVRNEFNRLVLQIGFGWK